MQYLAAFSLISLSGKEPTKETLTCVLKAAGNTVDDKQVDAVLASLKGKKIDDLISKGLKKVNVGGSAPAADKKKEQPKKEQAKKEVKKEEPKKKEPEPKAEEEDDFGAGGLFD